MSPANSNVVLVATNAGLFRSTNAGASFSAVPIATGQAGPPLVLVHRVGRRHAASC